MPANIGIDSSFRVGFLFGRNTILYKDALAVRSIPDTSNATFGYWRMEHGPRLPLLSGTVEVSPFQRLSVRFAGSIAIATGSSLFEFTAEDPEATWWDVSPAFRHWEAAGLYHLWTGGGYRFSLVGGYRQEWWKFAGGPALYKERLNSFREDLDSRIPFFGLQTAVFYPWWKARFELRGSPFMTKHISAEVATAPRQVEYRGWADDGGMVEFELEATVMVTTNFRAGVHARYSYQELHGETTRYDGSGQRYQDVFATESFGLVGLNLTVVF
jgi:hypothetical protein